MIRTIGPAKTSAEAMLGVTRQGIHGLVTRASSTGTPTAA
jgi:hypothetical protein